MRGRIRRWTPAVLLAGGVVGLLAYAFMPEPVAVDVVRVARGALTQSIDEEGRAVVRERYVVSAPVTGAVARVSVEPGDRVVAGAVLAAVQPAPMDERTRTQLVARVGAATAALQQAEAGERAASASYAFARAEHERSVELGTAGALSRGEVELAFARRAAAEGEWGSSKAAVAAAAHAVQEARAALLGSSAGPNRPSAVLVRAPLAATVLRVLQESERVVTSGTPLVELGDPAALEVVVDLLSSDAVRVPQGARVVIDQWGGGDPLHGRVRLIEPAGFTKISALGVEEQRVNVHIDLDDPAECWKRLGDGFALDVHIVVAERPNTLTLPAGGLFRAGDGWAAFVVESNRVRLRAVDVGLRAGYQVEILKGLNEGEEVVLHPSEAVVEGVRVARR
jgi:HlyD family secretion protein